MPARPRGNAAPLSSAQQRLWFLDRLEPGKSLYSIFRAYELCGPLALGALEAALSETVCRHEVLRSQFSMDDAGQPVQVAAAAAPLPLPVVDLSGLAAGRREEAARHLAAGEADRPFDLERGPLLRAAVLRLDARRHWLLLDLHHIACDARSLELLLRELAALYAAGLAGTLSPSTAPRLQYADFAQWEAERGEALEAHLEYWRERLAGLTELRLPFDRARPAVRSFCGGRWLAPLGVGLDRVGESARRLRTTRFALLLAAFAAFLRRVTGQEDLAVGSPFAGRTCPGTEDMIGFFVQMLVLRLDGGGDPSFSDLLRRVFVTLAEAQGHQDLPFDRLVRALRPERALSHNPLFQVVFAVQPASANLLALPGLEVARIPVTASTAKFDLILEILEGGEGGDDALVIEYSGELFFLHTVQRLAGCFGRLLAGCLDDPRRPLSELPLLSAAELHQVLGEWGAGSEVDGGEAACLPELFLRQVRRTPDAEALITPDERISYRELAQRARRLAAWLRSQGVRAEVGVGIFAERSAELVIGLLGTLLAGGAYVPLDPDYPEERLAFLLEDAAMPLVLAQSNLIARLPASCARVVCLEEVLAAVALEPDAEVAAGVDPGNFAYAIYTSGSTGRPKGVAITHGGAAARLRWARRAFRPEELAGILASTSICFDVSVFELFAPLAWGGRVILSRNVLELPRLAARDEVVVVTTVPSAMAELAESGGLPPSVRTLGLGGEPVRRPLAERLHTIPGIERVLNLYGPSEDTTYSTVAAIPTLPNGEPTIGRPLPGTRAYVLDGHLAILPRGAVGQLFLGGAGLSRGYLGRPELTAERFVPNPLSSRPGQRIYRTGDLARHRPDGELECLGRIDHQVKVRGFRVELGEIEAALAAIAGVREAVVVCQGSSHAPSLGAFFVADPGQEAPAAEALRSALRQRLPEYMVPAFIVRLDALPRTPNGKIDRGALPAAGSQVQEEAGRRLSTPLEELIADAWSAVLGHGGIGADADFFDLGGHSLLATRVLARLRDRFGIDLGVRHLFELRTVAALAAWIERVRWGASRPPAPPLTRVAQTGDLPLSFAQERLWFLEELDPGSAAYNLPAALEIRGPLLPAALAAGLAEIARRHTALRARFLATPRGPVQRIAPWEPSGQGLPGYVDLSALPLEEARREAGRLGRLEAGSPFDLATGPSLRAVLLRLAGDEHRLLLTFHHIVADGWSLALFFDELSRLYAAAAAGLPSPLPELAVQYSDYASWQRAWLAGAVLAEELDHWCAALAGVPPQLDLPTDRPRPEIQAFRGRVHLHRLPESLAGGLAALARDQGATPFMALLAGFEVLLRRYSGQDDLVVGTPVANRSRVEVEKLIGFFVNTLALRGDVGGDPSVAALLGRVRDRALAAYAHQDLPFEKLVAELQPERDQGRTPLFQVLLVFQNAPPAELQLAGLEVRALEVETGSAKFDLSLSLAESAVEPGGLAARWTFDGTLFDRATIARMAAQFAQLLDEMAAAPQRRLSELGMLTAAERDQLAAWNRTVVDSPPDLTLSRLIAAQIARTPDALALVCERERWTYRQLGARAGALARRLRRLGVGPEVCVGVFAERSSELVVGLLGVLFAGGAYVPLVPSYPRERLDAMVEDAAPRLLLAAGPWREEDVPGGGAIPVLRLEGIEPPPDGDAAGEDAAELAGPAGPDNLAYVIFTSGSTGRPKGVMNTHRGIVNRLLWGQRTFPLTADDRVAQKTPASFDVSVWEFFWPLLAGSVLVVARPDGHRDPAYLARLIAAEGITAIHFVPSMLRLFLAEPDLAACDAMLRLIIASGEALPGDLADLCCARLHAGLHNLYGPTEAAVEVTWWACEQREPGAPVPIGHPIANTEIHLLDRDLNPVPTGVPAELYIGGVQVARGYLGRPGMTAERFVPDPASGRAGARLYRTGDIARRRGDGAIDFLGRMDHQVKIRGVRVELGEIEAALRSHPALADAVVVALPQPGTGGPFTQHLVAYVAARPQGPRPETSELRDWLRRSLTEAMVPSAFVHLPALPLTPSGKVDRRALPAPKQEPLETGPHPRWTVAEELLAGIWAEVLGCDAARLGGGDDFFGLGGHSLLAAQVVARVREVFHREIPLREIFTAPTLAALAARIAAAGAGEAPEMAPFPVGPEGELPLSFAQERLWFLEQLRPGSGAYNVPLVLALDGPLDVGRLHRACAAVVERHPVLRVRFEAAGGEPVQRLSLPAPLPLPVVDLAAVEGGGEALALASAEAVRPFDLACGPLVRLLLLRRAADRHLLVLNFHHIVADGWSLGVFLREAAALYAGGSAAALRPLPVQYFDFARWQRRRGAELEAQLAFWRRRLDGAPPLLELPADRPRPVLPSYRGEKVAAALPPALAERLRKLSRRRGATLFMTLLAASSALLARLCGQEDLVVGTPVAERGHLALEGLIGLFVNTLALRCDLSGDPPFAVLQERCRDLFLEAYGHRELPFERLVQELAPVREMGLPPLVQALLVLQRSPLDDLDLPGIAVSHVPLPLGFARFDVTLSVLEGEASLPVALEYAADLFCPTTISRWLEHWGVMLEAVVERPELRLSELPLLSGAQRAQVLLDWNDQACGEVAELCVHELFEQAAARWPERIAVEWEGQRLTYAELAARSARLAERLRDLGVGPDAAVGLCAERSPELVVGLLGILRAGGCYLPLDPEYPAERLAYMLADSAVRVVLTQQRLCERLPDGLQSLLLDGPEEAGGAGAVSAGAAPPLPGHLAYVIYTSGSTGRPKGTLVAHRGVVNMLRWRQQRYPLGVEDRVLQTDSFSFDASVWQFFWPLSVGARLVLTRPGGHRDSGYLVELLARRRITVVGLVPSMMGVVVQEPTLERCRALRHVFCGGEALSLELVGQMCRRLPGLELHNVYGPTEATIDATDATYRGEEAWPAVRVAPIGRPLPHQRALVLDGSGAAAAPGVAGELFLGGVGLARGYHGQPALTAERFVPDGVTGAPGQRLYRTGDRVRWRANGRLEFLGRFDHQVKVRGFRIELREIEAALARHPAVAEAVAVAWDDARAGLRLVAYMVAADGQTEPTAAELRSFLRTALPEHMVPAAFVPLTALPLTPSGKLDRTALPLPTPGHLLPAGLKTPPRSELERLLAELWQDVLGVDQVGRDDNFFDLGGHSLRATQAVSRVRRACGVELPLSALFEAPTLAAFTDAVNAHVSKGDLPAPPPLVSSPRVGEPPLSFAQERLWFLARLEPGSAAYNIPAAVRLAGPLDVAALRASLGTVMARHEVLRTRFPLVAGWPVQRVGDRVPDLLPLVDLSALPEGERSGEAARLAGRAAREPFDLAAGPPLRTALLRLAAEEHELVLVLHHLLCDAWSMGLLFAELSRGYAERSPLPALPVQYADFAIWQRRWLAGEVLAAELAVWRERLDGAGEVLALPTDRPRPAVQTDRGATVAETWPEPLIDGVRALCRREGVTLFMTVLAALQALLHRYTGQDDFLVGTPVANRTRPETEGLIGLFVNTLVLRARLAGDPDFRTLLARTRSTALAAYEHQDLPFEKLVEAMRPQRDLSRPPLFQVLCSLQEEIAAPALAGLSARRRELASGTAKLDLTMALGMRRHQIRASCEYNRDLFDETTVKRMASHLRTLLAGALADPERPLWELPLLTAAERHQLDEWNDTAWDHGTEACLHELIAEQVARSPEAVAVVCEAASLTYAELAARAGALARHLARLGVGPEALVAVAMERSVEMVVALVAVLEAGGAYVPIDPSYPAERLTFMLEDSLAREAQPVLLTQEHVAATLPLEGIRARGGRVLLLDRDSTPVLDDGPLHAHALPDGPAYMIYTSGSTGRPKGAVNTHRAIVNRLLWMQEAFGLGPEDRVLQKTPFSFDVSVWEFFWPLIVGARLVLARPEGHQDVHYLAELIKAEGVTTLHFVPSMLQVFLGEPEAARCRSLRRVICSGEALPPELVGRFYRRLPHNPELHNLYGPTEAAVDVTWWPCSPADAGKGVPIGRPIENIDVHVVDRDFRRVAIGGAGELLLGGVGLARGYHARPDLTAERFVPNPFSSAPGSRLYRTGDLARVRTDGAVEYLGRLDHQIKLRGFRIELGEVEAALRTHTDVREAVVVARGEGLEERLVAFIVAAGDIAPEPAELRAHAQRALPDYMIPAVFAPLASLPLSANGKVDRRALPGLAALRQRVPHHDAGALSDLEHSLLALWRELLLRNDIGRHDSFFDLGGHSLLLVRLQERLEQTLGRRVPIVDLFRFPTIAALAEHLGTGRREVPTTVRPRASRRDGVIAIVGMAGRFPGAGDLAAFWRNLREGVDSISRFTPDDLVAAGVDPELLRDPGYVPAKGVLEGADLFAASFFGYSPREAELMDPQHRVLLECAWECLEDAGHDPARPPGRIGVFAGAAMNTYLLSRLAAHRELVLAAGGYPIAIGNDKDYVPTRISYRLDLRGPSVLVQTACSTSLVAVHLACRSLFDDECDLALAGGVAVTVPLKGGHLYREGGILSPDGRCRSFDAAAHGIVGGNGAGLVALRRLDDALADGDCIRAVLRGSAINNDGHLKAGFTAPSVDGQAEVIRQALTRAGVQPEAIGYIEAHGTGTPLGDPIEMAALHQVFRPAAGRRAFCAVGSVKTNIGHLDTAAGVAGLIKSVLALEHRELPPSLHFERPNPELGLEDSPFYVNARLSDWPAAAGEPRRAGVSSFGIGGTNAHVVLEEAPVPPPVPAALPWQLLTLSAQSTSALAAVASRLAAHLQAHPDLELARVAYTLQLGRTQLEHRSFVVCRDTADAAERLATAPAHAAQASGPEPPVAFLFPGQGSQHLDMGRELYELEPRFRADVDRCAEALAPLLGRDLRGALFPPREAVRSVAERSLEQTALTQPALFVIEYALARLWMSWGIRPQAMVGHSLGELVAATLAGVWSLEDALALVAERGRLLQAAPTGAMLAVELPEEDLVLLLGGGLALASVNAPRSSVASGPAAAVEALAARLRELGIEHRWLRVSHAFHSALVTPALAPFEGAVRKVALAPPQIPFLSNVSGTWITPAEATDPAYWARQLRSTVLFAPAVAELLAEPRRVLLEVGPGQALSALTRRQDAAAAPRILPSLPRRGAQPGSELAALLTAAGRLWLAGAQLDWAALHAERRPRRVPLPTYPFERQRFWLGEGHAPKTAAAAAAPVVSSGIRVEAELWRQMLPLRAAAPSEGNWLLLLDGSPLGRELARRLRGSGARVIETQGTWDGAGVAEEEALHVISLWGRRRMEPLRRLAATLAARRGRTEIVAVVRRGCAVAAEPPPEAAAARLMAGLAELAGLHPGPRWRIVDLDSAETEAAGLVLAEAASPAAELLVAYRGGSRWARERRSAAEAGLGGVREGGVYLVLGGLSRPGLSFLEQLAATPRLRIAATGPLPLPPPREWQRWLDTQPESDEVSQTLLRLRVLEAAGAELLLLPAERRPPGARRILSHLRSRFGTPDGVFDLGGLNGGRSSPRSRRLAAWRAALAETAANFVQVHDRRRPVAGLAPGCTGWTSVFWEPPQAAGPSEAPVHSRPGLTALFVPPADEVEEALTGIWRELLGFAEIGIQDDFFALGGDSLLATQVIARVRDRLGVQVPLSSVLEQPTVAALAEACRQARKESGKDPEISRLLEDVASLSTEDLERMLAQREPSSIATGDRE